MKKTFNHYKLLILYVFLFIFISCATKREVTIEILKPPHRTFSQRIDSVAVVGYKKSWGYSYRNNFFEPTKEELVFFAEEALRGAAYSLTESGIFDTIDVHFTTESPGSLSYRELCEKLNVRALIILDNFYASSVIYVNTNYGHGYYVQNDDATYTANQTFSVATRWEYYDYFADEEINTAYISKEEKWEAEDSDYDTAAMKLPQPYEMSEVAFEAGNRAGERIIPSWKPVERKYFLSGEDSMDMAELKAVINNWEEAGEIWSQYTDHPDPGIAKHATYNMALYYEIMGELEKAYEMARISYKVYFNLRAHSYMKKLKKRIEEQEELEKMFGY